LFARGKRPDLDSIREFAKAQQSVSLVSVSDNGVKLAELLRDGLTFDLSGLLPGDASGALEYRQQYGWQPAGDQVTIEAVQLLPNEKIASGARSPSIAKQLIRLAVDLVDYFDDAQAIVWPPAQAAIGRSYFVSTSKSWLNGGAFPAPGLIGFQEGDGGSIETVGLSFS